MQIHILAGSDIRDALKQAAQEADRAQEPAEFDFNGEVIRVPVGSNPVALFGDWQRRQDAAARAYRASPGYVREQAERAERAAEAQRGVNLFLELLEEAAPLDLRRGLKLLYLYQPQLDHVDVLAPWADLAQTFGVLAPAKWGVGRKDLKEPGNEEDAARWIVGQAVDAFRQGYPPHPMLRTFAEPILRTWGAS
ncbi:hypothetical protein [Deinococcus petrolearius]|uniref:Uncharacterized protein n=1 Tax=Deinococcus petrolearius TaxID=1751295 RepID=A0ABW1DD64_9DEIO